MKQIIFPIIAILISSCYSQKEDLTLYVDPFIGTGGHGHTYPGATLPFGMVQLSPDTGVEGWDWCSGYHESDSSIMGFSHTHLSGTGCGDLGDILLMPATGSVKFKPGTKSNPDEGYRSRFRRTTEKASAGYYTVYLEDPKVKVELSATKRTGAHRYTFDNLENQHIIVDLEHGIQDTYDSGELKQESSRIVTGFRCSKGWADKHTLYFAADFSEPIKSIEKEGDVYAIFFEKPTKEIVVKVGVSYVDVKGAMDNLKKESLNKSFDNILADAKKEWNTELGKIVVEGDNREDKIVLYTNLYHSMIAPTMMSDNDGRYVSSDRKIYKDIKPNYGLFSLWDTYRAFHPLMTILQPSRNEDFINSMIRYWEQSGRLPIWDLNMRENQCMIGYHSIPVIADAYMKGQRGFDAEKALKAMINSATEDSYGGLAYYRRYMYIPSNKEPNSVSKTLECAYDDWCIAQIAKAMGRDDIYKEYNRRAQYYKNHFDAQDSFMKGRDSQGKFIEPFSPTFITGLGYGDFTEGNSWHYSFYAPQDVNTLIEMMGGDEKFVEKLEELFTSETVLSAQSLDVSGMIGNYAQGNEPSHHAAYLFNYAGRAWMTQEKIHKIMNELYTTDRDGICGNEDCGQMSSWGVFSAMGFYPVTPASNIYVIGTPRFKKMSISLDNKKMLNIIANSLSKDNFYVKELYWNDQPYTKSYITHQMIESGGTLRFVMDSKPNREFGALPENRPISKITDDVVSSEQMLEMVTYEPYITEPKRVFVDKIRVNPISIEKNDVMYYTLDGSIPNSNSPKATSTITIDSDNIFSLNSISDNGNTSSTAQYKFYKGLLSGAKIGGTPPREPYYNGGLESLIDGYMGSDNFKEKVWLGFSREDVELEITLPKSKKLSSVGINMLNATGSWILLPLFAEVSFSNGGERFGYIKKELPQSNSVASGLHYTKIGVDNIVANKIYIKLKWQPLPDWHTSTGLPSWIFIDEITAY